MDILAGALPVLTVLTADCPAEEKQQAKSSEQQLPILNERTSRTEHSVEISGQRTEHTATAGTFNLSDEMNDQKASVFHIPYRRKDA